MQRTILTIAGLALCAAAPLSAQTPVAPEAPAQTAPPMQAAPAAPTLPPAPVAPDQMMTAINPQVVSIRLKFVPGTVWTYKAAMDMNMMMDMGLGAAAGPHPINEHTDMIITETVKSVRPSDGAATIDTKTTIDAMTMNGQTVPTNGGLNGPAPTESTYVLAPNGKVITADLSAAAGGPMSGMNFGSNAFSGMSGVFPAGPVKIGDTWASSLSLPMFGGLQFAVNSTLAGVDRSSGDAMAHIATKITSDLSSAGKIPQLQGMKVFGYIASKGQSQFDTDAGRLNSTTSDMNMKMTVIPKASASTPPSPSKPSRVKMNMHIVLTMDLVPNAPTTPGT